ncbi:MAG: hypothetical protein QXX95_05820 [Nitrososphaerales archaeon]
MKRPSSKESSGAIALTIASVILLSGFWSIWLSLTYDTRRYDEVAFRSIILEPLSSQTITFEAKKGQEIEIKIYYVGTERVIPKPGIVVKTLTPPTLIFPSFSVKIYDPSNKLVWAQANVTSLSYTHPPVSDSGTFRIEVNNPQEELLSLNIRVQDRSKLTVRPLEPLGHWLILISLPVFGLGVWFTRFKKANLNPPNNTGVS